MDKMDKMDIMKQKLINSIGEKRYRHSVNVMNTSIELARLYNVDEKSAEIAGLLHDCGRLKDKGIGGLEHATLGCEIASKQYGVDDIDILNAIRYHTTGRENMTMLEKIIYIADKIEPDRDYDGVDAIRKLAYKDLDMSIIESIRSTLDYLNSKGIEIDNTTLGTLNYLLDRRK